MKKSFFAAYDDSRLFNVRAVTKCKQSNSKLPPVELTLPTCVISLFARLDSQRLYSLKSKVVVGLSYSIFHFVSVWWPRQAFSFVRDSLFARDKEKSPTLAAAVQRQLNRALKHVYPLPLFSLLNIDRDTYGTMLEELCRNSPKEFQKAVTPGRWKDRTRQDRCSL